MRLDIDLDHGVAECLNAGYVRLVDHMGSDLSVVRAARVSYNADWRAGEGSGNSDRRLIQYLWKNKHTSPFEAVQFTFEVQAPIFVFRQWHRHHTWSFNEVSARYTELPEVFFIPEPHDIGVQSKDNKQMRDVGALGPEQYGHAIMMKSMMTSVCKVAFDTYRELLANGVPRELARSVLPLGTYSRMFATVDLRNLLHFLDLCIHPHAQPEVRVYAEAMRELVRPHVPECMNAWALAND